MQWIVHGTLAPAVRDAIARHEHAARTLADIGLAADAAPLEVLKAARQKQLDIVTNDPALVQAVFEADIWLGRCILFLQLECGETEQDDAIDRFFARYKRPAVGRLYTVTATRVKVRQLPSAK